jgi:hypothetical protein
VIDGSDWVKGILNWREARTGYLSIPFSWLLPGALEITRAPNLFIDNWVVGGPATFMVPGFFKDEKNVTVRDSYPGVLQKTNPLATRTTIGCPRRCEYCAIGRGLVEPGGFRELDDWPDLPLVCDNNLLHASTRHFDKVIDRLKKHDEVGINQGLDAALMTQYHANRLAELNMVVRLAWDDSRHDKELLRAITYLRKAKVPRRKIRCYVLIGYKDSPEDARHRFETLWYGLGIRTFPMRYVPPGHMSKFYVDPDSKWTDAELKRFMKYWSQAKLWSVPFDEFTLEKCHAAEAV